MSQLSFKQQKDLVDYDELVASAHSLGKLVGVEISSNKDCWIINLIPSKQVSDKEAKVLFMNALYDAKLRKKLESKTSHIKNLIFAAAFSNIELE